MQKMLFLALFGLFACSSATQSQTVIDAAQTENMLKTDPAVQLIDLRTPAEWQQTGAIEDALRINFNNPDFQAQAAKLDKNKPVIVYCAVGGRSSRAAAMLAKMGFQQVFDYAGGMSDWKAKGKKTVQ